MNEYEVYFAIYRSTLPACVAYDNLNMIKESPLKSISTVRIQSNVP